MKLRKVLLITEAKNKDIIIRLAIAPWLQGVMPGQYVYVALNIESSDSQNVTAAFIFVENVAAAYVEIYVRRDEAQRLNVTPDLSELVVSDVQGDAFMLPDVCVYGGSTPHISLLKNNKKTSKPVLLADEAGLPAIIFLAEKIKTLCQLQPLVFLFSVSNFPFTPIPSQFVISNIPMGVLAACPMLEDKKIPSRLVNDGFAPGCYDGSIDEFLTELPLSFFDDSNIALYAAGKGSTLDSVKCFSEKWQLELRAITDCVQPV